MFYFITDWILQCLGCKWLADHEFYVNGNLINYSMKLFLYKRGPAPSVVLLRFLSCNAQIIRNCLFSSAAKHFLTIPWRFSHTPRGKIENHMTLQKAWAKIYLESVEDTMTILGCKINPFNDSSSISYEQHQVNPQPFALSMHIM